MEANEAGATPTSAVRDNLQTVEDAIRVFGNEALMDTLPYLQSAFVTALSGGEVDFDDVRRQFQQSVEKAKARLGETGTAAAEFGSVVVPGGIGAKIAGKGREIVGGITGATVGEFVRGAAEPEEPDTLSTNRLISGAERAPVGVVTGGATGAALKGGRMAGERIGEAISNRRQANRTQTDADLRRRGEALTARPGGPRALDVIDEQPEGFFAEIAQGVASNQTIEQIGRRLRVSQDDVARALLRNRERFAGGVPGDRTLTNVRIGGEDRTLDRRNVARLVREAREITDTVDRYRAATPQRQRMQVREQPDQPDPMPDASPARPQIPANQSAPVLDNAVRARLVAQATGQRPARSKLENLDLARENLNSDNERAVAEALNLDPDAPRLRDRIMTALEGLRRPGVSAFAGMTAAGAASEEADARQLQTQGEEDAGFKRDLEDLRGMLDRLP